MNNENNEFSRGAQTSSPQHKKHKTGQSSGAAVAPKKDGLTEIGSALNKKNGTDTSLLAQAKDTAGQAFNSVAETANTKIEERKSVLSNGLASVADSVRQVGENLKGEEPQEGIAKYTAEYSGAAAWKIDQVANYFESNDVKAMYRDVENFARTNPAIFIGGAFALGILAARFLKSSNPKQLTKAAGQNFGTAGLGY